MNTVKLIEHECKWYKIPPCAGMYYLALKPENWDVAQVYPVWAIDNGVSKWMEVEYEGKQVNVLSFKSTTIWFGPLQKRTKPEGNIE